MTTTRRTLLLGSLGLGCGAGLGGAFRAAGGKEWKPPLLRPPGALEEDDFLATCLRCGQCVQACPFDTLVLAGPEGGVALGTPYLDPEVVPCYLCRGHDELKCIAACPTGALRPVLDERAIRMGTAVILHDPCLAYNRVICRSCWHACPFPNEAIFFDEMLRPKVNREVCIGCGLCTHACPTERTSIPIRPRGVDLPAREWIRKGKRKR
ncbi:MAG: 4Fe-4S dicluster domain-containing protein [Planctomycetota bacterium]|jgi:MauM/NapG family ferredoxin protein